MEKKINVPTVNECNEMGKMIGNLHNLTSHFNESRKNSLDINEWKKLHKKCQDENVEEFKILLNVLKDEINFIEKSWPNNLPSGIIHADLFKDNIFFKDEKITGVIDFYFSCNHFFLYDICIVVNDWCFKENGNVFDHKLFKNLIDGYNTKRKLTNKELSFFNMLLRTASVRILITRLHDYIFHPEDAIVLKKDPYQYYNILKWHQKNKKLKI